MAKVSVLVVDDDDAVRSALTRVLAKQGYQVRTAASAAAAEGEYRAGAPDVAIVDEHLPDGRGLELLTTLRRIAPTPIIMLTGRATIDLAVDAVKRGAEHFFSKPVENDALVMMVNRAIENFRNRRLHVAHIARDARTAHDPFVGVSDAIKRVAELANRILDSDRPVLIQGETGTGKGVLASWLHQHGRRGEEALVDINCASLSGELMESELFGHERGAFTGAATAKLGLLEVADRGTLFLDEIGEIGINLQPRLLKVLEDGRFRRVGDVHDRTVDIRLIAATNRDLGQLAQRGAFRSDLYFRINTLCLTMPPLRERPEDLPVLVRAIAAGIGGGRGFELTPAAMRALETYPWPGNVRELRNVLERAVLLSNGATRLDREDLPFHDREPGAGDVSLPPADEVDTDSLPDHLLTLEAMERRHVERVVRSEETIELAARRLGLSRSTLYQRLRQYRERDRGRR